MANEYNRNLFGRLTKLFRSGPVVRRRVKGMNQKTGTASTALEVFRAAHSDVYNSTLSSYGAFDRLCIDLDTRIPAPGSEKYLTLRELIERHPNGEKFTVYAYDREKGQLTPAWAHHPRSSGVRETVKIDFDDGTYLVCTPDHPCMMRDGNFRDAADLTPGDSMMPFCDIEERCVIKIEPGETVETGDLTVDGYENFATDTIVVHNSRYSDFCLVGDTHVAVNHPDAHKKISDIVEDYQGGALDYGVFSMHDGEVRHGIIENAWCTGEREIWEVELDNGNIVQCTDNHPFMLRNGEYCRADQLVVGAALMPYKRLKNNRNFVPVDNRYENLCAMPAAEHLASHARINNKRFEIKKNPPGAGNAIRKDQKGTWSANANKQRVLQSIYSAYVPGMDIEQLALKLDAPSPKHIINRLKRGGYETWESFVTTYSNHKVAAVRKTDRIEKVYDITVKDYHNFALTDCHGNGTVFVHNSEMEACIAGDTLIATPDGYVEIQELAKRYGPDETFIVYSYDHEKKQIVPALGKQARKTVTEMSFKVTFDSGKVLIATPDHRVMRRDGTYCEVQDLKPGDSMMPFYRRDLIVDKQRHSELVKENNPVKRSDITFARILQVCDRDGYDFYNVSRVLDCSLNTISHCLSENGFKSFETFARAYDSNWTNSGCHTRGDKNSRYDSSLTFQKICDAFKGQTSQNLADELGTTQTKIKNRVKAAGFSSWSDFRENFANHKVVSVEPHDIIDLYDLTVDGYKNYATDSIIVHNTPEICAALDIYSEETAAQGTDGRILHIHSDNRKIQELLQDLFYDTVNVEFNLPMWVRNLVKYGDFFLFLDVSPDFGVLNCIPISISEIEREEGFDPSDPMAVRFRWTTRGNRVLENWQVAHFRLLGNDAFLPYGSSVLEGARRIWRQLILIEDAMLVYRVIRAPERRVFYIDVGNVPPEEISNYLEQAQSSLKRNEIVDKNTGKVDLRFNPMAVDQDYFLPVRGGESGTKIDTLAGGQNTAAIEDVQYIQKKLFAALKIPKAYLGYDEETGCFTGNTRVSLLDGREVEIERLVEEHEAGKQNWVHSYDSNTGQIIPGRVVAAWKTKDVTSLYEVTVDTGDVLRCTDNHPFLLRDGTYVRADQLVQGQSLMALKERHEVVSIRRVELDSPVPVFDLEIERWHNFAVALGGFTTWKGDGSEILRENVHSTYSDAIFVHNSKATLAQEDIRFSRSIQRIQKTVLSELNKLAMIHLYSHGYEGDDLMDFTLRLSNPSSIAQQQKLELISTKFDIAGKAPEGLVSRRWIRKNILELTDQEIELLKDERKDDKLEDTQVEDAGTADESEPGDEGESTEGEEESGAGGGAIEDLFSGDSPEGDLLVAAPSARVRVADERSDDEDEEDDFVSPSIDDDEAPVKISNQINRTSQKLNMFGEPIKRSRKQTRGASSTGMHDFAKMTGLGNTQSTLRDPFQKNWVKNPMGVDESSEPEPLQGGHKGHQLVDKLKGLKNLRKPSILREAGSVSSEDEDSESNILNVDLNSLRSDLGDE